jgi:hypothetical protein
MACNGSIVVLLVIASHLHHLEKAFDGLRCDRIFQGALLQKGRQNSVLALERGAGSLRSLPSFKVKALHSVTSAKRSDLTRAT